MFLERKVQKILEPKPTIEGAGVRLKRVLGNDEDSTLDPFLLLDHFGSNNPEDYVKGFPWHPHRGIETATYIWAGKIEHRDSMGNKGVIRSGDVQWMTAGSGIIHQEMPKKYPGLMQGFQLWVNLPAKKKMTDPKYRGIDKDQIPIVQEKNAKIRVMAGRKNGAEGPVRDLSIAVEYFDVELAPDGAFEHVTPNEHTVFAYVVNGSTEILNEKISEGQCVVFSLGDSVKIHSKIGSRFLFVSGEPLKEHVAWRGPIVMNTQEELQTAFEELDAGTFVKTKKAPTSS